jgi:hypothetical protein
MHDDRLTRLAEAGVPVARLTHAQREVIEGLNETELNVLTGVAHRIGNLAGDVEGQEGGPIIFIF